MKVGLLRGILRIFSWVPAHRSHLIARPLAFLLWHAGKRKRHTTLRNLEVVYPDLAVQERETLARESLVHYIRGAIEIGMLWHISAARMMVLLKEVRGAEYLREAREHGRGVIIAGPHWGAWELMSSFLPGEFDGAIMYKPSRHTDLEAEILKNRLGSGVEFQPSTRSGLKKLYGHLKAGHAIGIACDQEPSDGMGRWVPFFGIPAVTSVIVPRLIRKTGCRVVLIGGERLESGRYRVHFLPVDEAMYSEDVDEALTALNRGVERCIAIDPSQYLWTYKRFRHGPGYTKGIY